MKSVALELEDPSLWIERRVESLTFLNDSSTRRSVSFDYVVRPIFQYLGFVPLAFYRKENLSTLDVRSAAGIATSILTTYDAVDLAIRLLEAGTVTKLTNADHALIDEIVFFTASGTASRSKEKDLLTRYARIIAPGDPGRFLTLAQLFFRSFILWVQLPDDAKPNQRMITKVAYEESLPFEGTFPPRPLQTVVHPNWCSRFHFEVIAPPELKITSLKIREDVEVKPTKHFRIKSLFFWRGRKHSENMSAEVFAQITDVSLQVGHVSMFGDPDLPPMQVNIEIVPSPGGTSKISFMVAFATAAVFLIPTIFKLCGSNFLMTPQDGTSASLLLLGPAMLVAYLARSPEHPIVAHRLRGARYSLMASGTLLMLAAGLLGGLVSKSSLRIVWYLLTFLSVCAGLALLSWGRKSKLAFLRGISARKTSNSY